MHSAREEPCCGRHHFFSAGLGSGFRLFPDLLYSLGFIESLFRRPGCGDEGGFRCFALRREFVRISRSSIGGRVMMPTLPSTDNRQKPKSFDLACDASP